MTKRTEQNILLAISIIGLVCLLSYTFVHTGGLLAQYIRPEPFGYAAAFGIEILIAGLAWRYARATPSQKKKFFLLFSLTSALIVSAFANTSEGYLTRFGEHLTLQNVGQIDPIQAIIGVSATGLISLLVFAISDIVGGDVHHMAKNTKAEADSKPIAKQSKQSIILKPEQHERLDYSQDVFALLSQGVKLGPTAMAERVGCSKGTASKWINEWQTKQNGSGVNGKQSVVKERTM